MPSLSKSTFSWTHNNFSAVECCTVGDAEEAGVEHGSSRAGHLQEDPGKSSLRNWPIEHVPQILASRLRLGSPSIPATCKPVCIDRAKPVLLRASSMQMARHLLLRPAAASLACIASPAGEHSMYPGNPNHACVIVCSELEKALV